MLWEYQIVSLPTQNEPKEAQEILNSLGENGWELVSAYTNQDLVSYIFKKPKQELGRAKRKTSSER
jgi:hypothetical protein